MINKTTSTKVKLNIIQPHGFCGDDQHFGVARAIALIVKTCEANPDKAIYCLGEVVHNLRVVKDLEKKYHLITVSSLNEVPHGSTIIIRAHGTGPETYQIAATKNLKVVDATCPLVTHTQNRAKQLIENGKTVILVCSSPDHDEAQGIYLQANKKLQLQTLDQLNHLEIENPENTVILTQTTLSIIETQAVFKKLKDRYPTITIEPHICKATTDRQTAVINACKTADLILVVGDQTSSNTQRLKNVAESQKKIAFLIETPEDLKKEWFDQVKEVAITSGASASESQLNEIVENIKNLL